MKCEKCNTEMEYTSSEKYRNKQNQIYRVIEYHCSNCNFWKFAKEYIFYEEVDGRIETTYILVEKGRVIQNGY